MALQRVFTRKGVYMDTGFGRMDGDPVGWAQDSQYGVSHRLRAFVVWIREERDEVAASEIPWTGYNSGGSLSRSLLVFI